MEGSLRRKGARTPETANLSSVDCLTGGCAQRAVTNRDTRRYRRKRTQPDGDVVKYGLMSASRQCCGHFALRLARVRLTVR